MTKVLKPFRNWFYPKQKNLIIGKWYLCNICACVPPMFWCLNLCMCPPVSGCPNLCMCPPLVPVYEFCLFYWIAWVLFLNQRRALEARRAEKQRVIQISHVWENPLVKVFWSCIVKSMQLPIKFEKVLKFWFWRKFIRFKCNTMVINIF